jgi:hypothetical protein
MQYFLLHVSTFVPICAKILIAPWGMKVSWLIYLFFTYVLFEHREFNGHPVKAFANLQRQAECCIIGSLFLSHWISPTIAVLPFLALLKAKDFQIDSLNFAFVFFLLFSFDVVQIALVALSIMSALLQDTEEFVATPEGWHRACTRMIMFRGIQVLTITTAYEPFYIRVLMLLFSLALKACVFWYNPTERPDRIQHTHGDPVKLLQGRSHFL